MQFHFFYESSLVPPWSASLLLSHYSEHAVTLSLAVLLSIDHLIEVVIAWYRMVVSHASPYPHTAVFLCDCAIIVMKR